METSLQSRIGTPCILITSTVHRNSADVNVYSNPESFRRMPLLSSEGTLGCQRKEKCALDRLKWYFFIVKKSRNE